MRGRYPDGPEHIDKLTGDAQTKERLKAILGTLYGEARVLEVCAQLGVGETRFGQLREAALQGALAALTPRPAGRPRRAASESDRIAALRRRIEGLEQKLHEAEVREEIALILPHVRLVDEPGKKMPAPSVKVHKPR